jgi:hypothetical protein
MWAFRAGGPAAAGNGVKNASHHIACGQWRAHASESEGESEVVGVAVALLLLLLHFDAGPHLSRAKGRFALREN